MTIIVYSLECCPHCEELKQYLKANGHEFEDRDMSTAESQTDLKFDGVFVIEAPVLKIDDTYYTTETIFDKYGLNPSKITNL